jgi:hypothetical protein
MYAIAFVLMAIALYYYTDDNMWVVFKQSGAWAFVISVIIGLINYAISGWLYRFQVLEITGKRLNYTDTLFLPTAMNMWSYLLPIQGGMLYSLAFFKLKYRISLSMGTSLSVFTYAINVFIGGCAGLIFTLLSNDKNIFLTIISLGCLISPFLLLLIDRTTLVSKDFRYPLLVKGLSVVKNLLSDSSNMLRKKRLLMGSILLNLLHSITMIAWFYWSSLVLDSGVSLMGAAILGLFLKISIILRITPGNLGLEQILAGALAAIIGSGANDGVIISIYMTLSTLFIVFTFGLIFTVVNLKYFGKDGLSDLVKSMRLNNLSV